MSNKRSTIKTKNKKFKDEKIAKSSKKKKVFFTFLIVTIILLFILVFIYLISSIKEAPKHSQGLTIYENIPSNKDKFSGLARKIREGKFEISESLVDEVLNGLKVEEHLHRSLINLEKPIINFKIGKKEFSSEIGRKAETSYGLSNKADIQINSEEETIIEVINSNDPVNSIIQSISQERINIDILAGKIELLSKGYKSFYNSLS